MGSGSGGQQQREAGGSLLNKKRELINRTGPEELACVSNPKGSGKHQTQAQAQ